jgi:hypothetical protein
MSSRWGSTPRLTDWLTVSRNVTLTLTWLFLVFRVALQHNVQGVTVFAIVFSQRRSILQVHLCILCNYNKYYRTIRQVVVSTLHISTYHIGDTQHCTILWYVFWIIPKISFSNSLPVVDKRLIKRKFWKKNCGFAGFPQSYDFCFIRRWS